MGSASTDPIAYWRSLPEELKAKLRLGFTGLFHLLDITDWCLRSGDPALTPIIIDALTTALRENPLAGNVAAQILFRPEAVALLPDTLVAALKVRAEFHHAPTDMGRYGELIAARDFPALKAYLGQKVTEEPDNLFWREQVYTITCVEGDTDFCADVMACEASFSVEYCSKEALERLGALFQSPSAPGAVPLIDQWRTTPWNISLLLRGHDLAQGVADKRTPLPGSVAVLLYSWNKADELEATLASLFESELGEVSIFVLDNGSTDHTAQVAARWQQRFGETLGAVRFHVETLPVNVGAPVARNWLKQMDAVQAHEFICYLDDDVVLPKGWLSRLGAGVEAYPDAGVWGCKVVDDANDRLIQAADQQLLPSFAASIDLRKPAPNPFRLSDLHVQTLDGGGFDYLRPCGSVTGCCHLFRAATLMESGDFSLHLSPSQYDDMEHDLRLCEKGLFPVYQGHLTVRHKKRTGAAARVTPQAEGSALGNKYKMQTMHGPEAIKAAANALQELLEADLIRKMEKVG